MGYTKTIVCLANSWKRSGRCVAGREITPEGFGGWIRPVSARPDGELNDDEQRCTGGTDAALLDVVEIPLFRPQPDDYQRENHLIDPALRWTKRGVVTWSDLQAAVEDPDGPLWPNGHSSSHGLNDQVPVDLLAEQGPEVLVEVRGPVVAVQVAHLGEGVEFRVRLIGVGVDICQLERERPFRRRPAHAKTGDDRFPVQ